MKKSINTKAVALKYKAYEDNAPKVVAKGKGEVALKIIQKAKEFDVPLFENEALANMLLSVEVDEEIPPELYRAVVDVFIWLNDLEKRAELSRR
jgi:flagellar biosynthesis protein